MKEIRITVENAQKAFNQAGDNQELKDVLLSLFGEVVKPEPKDITERVKSYEDACKVLNIEPLQLGDMAFDVAAYLKLRTIVEALNEGWFPQFADDECRYYPWFYLYTQEEIDEMEDKEDIRMIDTELYNGSYAGFADSNSAYAPSDAYANIGSRLCLKSRELAIYCGKQFTDIWADFHLVRKD